MKPALQLSMSQQLTLTPQLQQAIRLLQLSNLDLSQEIQELLDSNSMLEINEEQDESQTTPELHEETASQSATESLADRIGATPSSQKSGTGTDTLDFDRVLAHRASLRDHLQQQINLTTFSATEKDIANALVDAINQQGLLCCDLSEIKDCLNETLPEDQAISLTEIETVLCHIQHLDSIGVGARDLQECLLIQLQELSSTTPWRQEAINLIREHYSILGKCDYKQLMQVTKLERHDIDEILNLVRRLNPRPDYQIDNMQTQYIVPDVLVHRFKGQWHIELNQSNLPSLCINQNYSKLLSSTHTEDNKFVRTQLQEARWFLKSLKSRNETLLKVAKYIFEFQHAFLDEGPQAMKPLVLNQVAQAVELHESTISRVTTEKYVETPFGVFELKYFFSSLVGKDSGQEFSSTAIRSLLKNLIHDENPQKPLNDNKLADLLKQQGIPIARRTVAKYREALNIPPSNERKSFT